MLHKKINKKTITSLNNLFIAELMFLETSALTGENVEEAFLKCSRTILGKIETGKLETGTLCCLGLITNCCRNFSFISQILIFCNSFIINGISDYSYL